MDNFVNFIDRFIQESYFVKILFNSINWFYAFLKMVTYFWKASLSKKAENSF